MVEIKQVGTELIEETEIPVFEATDLATGSLVESKNWFEKSKDKWHLVLGANSANRKYVAHNEILANLNEEGKYVVEDKTTGPRVIGTARPHKKLEPYMTEEDRATYEDIIARAIAAKEADKPAKVDPNSVEGLTAAIARMQAKLAALTATDAE